jgi:hypothetical protein
MANDAAKINRRAPRTATERGNKDLELQKRRDEFACTRAASHSEGQANLPQRTSQQFANYPPAPPSSLTIWQLTACTSA